MRGVSTEHQIQVAYFDWVKMMRNGNPLYWLIYANVNGAKLPFTKVLDRKTGKLTRVSREAKWLLAEGLTPGVADVTVGVPNWKSMVPCLYLEFKAGKNQQTEEQKLFQERAESVGCIYAVVRDFVCAQALTLEHIRNATGD